MTPADDAPSIFDLPDDQLELLHQELGRIFGGPADDAGGERPSRSFMWVLPAPTFDEAMALLREVPSGSGEAGLNAMLALRAPELAEPEQDDTWTDEQPATPDATA